ncbi:MAG TPA: peroxide stress protein YaaA [Spongiibacteraceae bacterium]|nr:peroxide stress protein YaaA [Spongiibacteraceae bacterium]
MLIVISPAKTLDFETPAPIDTCTQPQFLDESQILIERLRELDPIQIGKLMSISDDLAELNHRRNMNWSTPFSRANAKQALLAFRGDVYIGLQADTFTAQDFEFAQKHLRILSGLYGLLRPLDLMQPYRLEMGTALMNARGRNLYAFWGDRITAALNAELQQEVAGHKQREPVLVNLASEEYFKAVHPKALAARVVTPIFKERKGDAYKVVSFYAKKARGTMSRYIIRNRLNDVTELKRFAEDGYAFNAKFSTTDEWVFTRE